MRPYSWEQVSASLCLRSTSWGHRLLPRWEHRLKMAPESHRRRRVMKKTWTLPQRLPITATWAKLSQGPELRKLANSTEFFLLKPFKSDMSMVSQLSLFVSKLPSKQSSSWMISSPCLIFTRNLYTPTTLKCSAVAQEPLLDLEVLRPWVRPPKDSPTKRVSLWPSSERTTWNLLIRRPESGSRTIGSSRLSKTSSSRGLGISSTLKQSSDDKYLIFK